MRNLGKTATLASALLLVAALAPAQANHGGGGELRTVVDGLDGPRGVDTLGYGKTLITESDGSFSLVIERRRKAPRVIALGSVPGGFAPAIAAGRHGRIYILTGAGGEPGSEQPPGATTLFEWRHGYAEPKPVFNVGDYQAGDPDPYDLEEAPEESNPFGLAALRDGSVLIADAAGNDLLRWWPNGKVVTVAKLKPRVVDVPEELGLPVDEMPSEAVATSVTVGADGYWYVGELRGFPATPGTSQIWRIKPGTVGAVCNPEKPRKGRCKRHADGLTSIMDLGADRRALYAVSLSKLSWLAIESEEPIPGAEIGGLFRITKHGHRVRIKELAKDQLVLPGGVDVKHAIYVIGPVFGPGALSKIH
jgi:hypothetical protein